jgi:hypothetical protein
MDYENNNPSNKNNITSTISSLIFNLFCINYFLFTMNYLIRFPVAIKIFHFLNKTKKAILAYRGDEEDDEEEEEEEKQEKEKEKEQTPIKYEDKYMDVMSSKAYVFTAEEIKLECEKLVEFTRINKENIKNEKMKLNKEVVERGLEYIDIDELVMVCENEENIETIREKRKMSKEEEINKLRGKIKELDEKYDDDEIIHQSKQEARNYVINERLNNLKNNFIIEKTPLGNVIMYYNHKRESFEYYSDNAIPYRFLETVGRKYVKTFGCAPIFYNMEYELSESERKRKEKEEEENEEMKREKETNSNTINNASTNKKNVFAKFKSYNKESTGRVNTAVAPKNSIPNNKLTSGKQGEPILLKENANRYTCEGKLSNFNFLKKPDRKVIDKKFGMTFADFKKMKEENKK